MNVGNIIPVNEVIPKKSHIVWLQVHEMSRLGKATGQKVDQWLQGFGRIVKKWEMNVKMYKVSFEDNSNVMAVMF